MTRRGGEVSGPRTAGRHLRGFTLLEMLVALAVFGVVGVMAGRILTGVMDMSEFTRVRSDALADAARAFAIIERDVTQLAHRSVRDEFGLPAAPLTVGGGATTLAEFTRAGWQNPLALPRTQLQRVAYAQEEDTLVRLFWPVVDRADSTEPLTQTLLAGVDQVTFLVRDADGGEHTYWPLGGDAANAPAAIEVRLRLASHGPVQRRWLMPAAMTFAPRAEDAPPDEAPA